MLSSVFPYAIDTFQEKMEQFPVPSGAEAYNCDKAEYNAIQASLLIIEKSIRMGATIVAITGSAESFSLPRIVRFTGATDAASGLRKVTASFASDLQKKWAAALAVLNVDGSTASGSIVIAGVSCPVMLMPEGIISGSFVSGKNYWPDASGGFTTAAISGVDPVLIALSATTSYFRASGIKQ
jgi:hypothetical protein